MTKREKILASAVAAILAIVVLQFGYSSYRSAISKRENQLFSLTDQVNERQIRQLEGAVFP